MLFNYSFSWDRGREEGRTQHTLHIQSDSLADLPDSILDLTPVVTLVTLLHGPQHQGPVGVELGLAARRLDVVEDGWLSS